MASGENVLQELFCGASGQIVTNADLDSFSS
jgi:hypothetical protein